MNVNGLVKQLKKERDRVAKQLAGIEAALSAFGKVYRGAKPTRRRLSAKARAKIAAAQRKRWAAWKAQQKKAT